MNPELLQPLFVGVTLATALWAVATVQLYAYLRSGHSEHIAFTITVITVWLLDSVHEIVILVALHDATIKNLGNHQIYGVADRMLALQYIIEGLAACMVQCMYAYRILIIKGKKPILPIIIACLAILGLVLTAWYTIEQLKPFNVAIDVFYNFWLVPASAAATFLTDVVITTSLCLYFGLEAQQHALAGSKHLLDKLFIWSLSSGLLTALCAAGTVVAVFIGPAINGQPYIIFFMCTGRLYVNSLLASLNARDRLRSSVGRSDPIAITARPPRFSNPSVGIPLHVLDMGDYGDSQAELIPVSERSKHI